MAGSARRLAAARSARVGRFGGLLVAAWVDFRLGRRCVAAAARARLEPRQAGPPPAAAGLSRRCFSCCARITGRGKIGPRPLAGLGCRCCCASGRCAGFLGCVFQFSPARKKHFSFKFSVYFAPF